MDYKVRVKVKSRSLLGRKLRRVGTAVKKKKTKKPNSTRLRKRNFLQR